MAGVQLVGGAVLGLAFSDLWKAVKCAKDRVKDFKNQLTKLDKTLRDLNPMIQAIESINTTLKESDQREVERLTSIMKEGNELVSRCLGISRFNIFKKSSYQKKLVELDNKIIRFHIIHVQLGTFLEVKKVHSEQRSRFDALSDQIRSLSSPRATTPIIGDFRRIILLVLNTCIFIPSAFREVKFVMEQRSMESLWLSPSMGMFGLIIFFVLIIYRSKTAIISMLEKSGTGIWMVIQDVVGFKTTFEQLDDTMRSLVPLLDIKEMESNSEFTERSRSLVEEGEMLVSESSEIGWWNFVKKWQYQRKLVDFDNKLLTFCRVHVQVSLLRNIKMIRQEMRSEMKNDESLEPARYNNEDPHKKKGKRGRKKEKGKHMDARKHE